MIKFKSKDILNKEIIEKLPIQFLFPAIDEEQEKIPAIYLNKSSFYQSNASICYASSKPISKIVLVNEKLF